MKLKIQSKLLVYILSVSTIIYALSFGYISYKNYSSAIKNAERLTDVTASKYAFKVISDLNEYFAIARTLSQSFAKAIDNFDMNDLSTPKNILKNVLEHNPQFYNVALHFELSAIIPGYKNDYGRLRILYFYSGGLPQFRIDTLELEGDNVGSPYHDMKLYPREEMSEPYLFSPYGNNVDLNLISSISVPIIENNKYVGLLQFDVKLDSYNALISEIHPYKSSEAFLLSNKGVIVSGTNEQLINKKIENIDNNAIIAHNILTKIKEGNSFSYLQTDSTNIRRYYSYFPLKFGNTSRYWSLGISVPYVVILSTARNNLIFSIIALIIGFFILLVVIWYISRSISVPLTNTASIIQKLAIGDISSDYKLTTANNDEISDINNSVNSLIDGLGNNIKFALEIEQGNLGYDFKPISNDDALGIALLNMRRSLRQAAEEEKRRKLDDQKLNWATQGSAKFGELMRENTDNLMEFSYNIISNLIKYMHANQGGLFIINDSNKEDVFIELAASYAYNRRKYIDKKIKMGVGLVGRCVNEQETIYMTDFPDDYLNISSGLGEATPVCLLLVPIVFNTKVFGVIEMASFNKMEKYQIDFVERIGESIGSTISNVKMNEQTAMLLAESKIQSEELVAQEEEMRQNIEEMKTTHEEMGLKILDYEAINKALNSVSLIAEFDMQGRLTEINQNFLSLINKSKEEVIGMFQGSFAITQEDRRNLFRDFWNELRRGITKKTIQHISINNKNYYLYEFYMPILDKENQKPYKVINFSIDITKVINTEAESNDKL